MFHRPTVQYLHKTVKDYVEKPKVQRRLSEGLNSSSDTHFLLCSANLRIFKAEILSSGNPRWNDGRSRSVVQAMKHASRMAHQNVPKNGGADQAGSDPSLPSLSADHSYNFCRTGEQVMGDSIASDAFPLNF